MTDTIAQPELAELDEAQTVRRRNLRTRQVEVWASGTADQVWRFDRVEIATTPWEITHRPTGVTMHVGTLEDCARAAGDPDTIGLIRERAVRLVRRTGRDEPLTLRFVHGLPVRVDEPATVTAERLGRARRILAVLDGKLVDAPADAVCVCGGLLALLDGERAVHTDECRECHGLPLEQRRRCRCLDRHAPCDGPEARHCDHAGCSAPAVPSTFDGCAGGREWCCGCCHDHE